MNLSVNQAPIPILESRRAKWSNFESKTSAFSNFKPSEGSNDRIWEQDLWQFHFQTLIRLNEWFWDQKKCQIRFPSYRSLKLTLIYEFLIKNIKITMSCSKLPKNIVSSPNQPKFFSNLPGISDLVIKFESKTSTNSSFRPSKGPMIEFDLVYFTNRP